MSNEVTLRTPTAEEIAQARLPARYEAARTAIAECVDLGELKALSDRQAALASYARLAQDTTLHNLALRIQQRAQRRLGELLKQIPRADEATRFGQAGDHPPVTRTQAAADAGLSAHQRKTALRIANVPEASFEAAVESDRPPTVTEMAGRGTIAKPLSPAPEIIPAAPAVVQTVIAALGRMASVCAVYDPASVALACRDPEIARGYIETIDAWLDRFVTRLPASADDLLPPAA